MQLSVGVVVASSLWHTIGYIIILMSRKGTRSTYCCCYHLSPFGPLINSTCPFEHPISRQQSSIKMSVEHIHPFRKWIFVVVIPSTHFFFMCVCLFRGIYIIGYNYKEGDIYNWIFFSYSCAFNRENVIKNKHLPPLLF